MYAYRFPNAGAQPNKFADSQVSKSLHASVGRRQGSMSSVYSSCRRRLLSCWFHMPTPGAPQGPSGGDVSSTEQWINMGVLMTFATRKWEYKFWCSNWWFDYVWLMFDFQPVCLWDDSSTCQRRGMASAAFGRAFTVAVGKIPIRSPRWLSIRYIRGMGSLSFYYLILADAPSTPF